MFYDMPCIAKCAMLVMMVTLSAAISLRNQHSGNFSLQQKSKYPAVRHGPSALARVDRKYGKATPVHDEVTANSSGDDIITPTSNDKEYLTPVTIGGQTLNLQVDTGSSDLWVFSPLLPTAEQRGHKIYDPSLSNTSKALANDTCEIIYGDGSQGASGGVCTDTVAVGTIVIQNQAVQLAAKLTARFLDDTSSDG